MAPDVRSFQPLTSYSTPLAFTCDTGLSIHENLLLPAILEAEHEVVFTTCFWARSASLDELVNTLKLLSAKTLAVNDTSRIKVYICFSSRSALQKLFHTSSLDGYDYPPSTWAKKLGLPPPSELRGLDIVVKSLFFRPFSVLHSKYLIVDRKKVVLPSCNVSWEEWYECGISFEGPIVHHVFEFWKLIWKPPQLSADLPLRAQHHGPQPLRASDGRATTSVSEQPLRTTLLPHPHNSSLRQALWLLPRQPALQATPLNETLLSLITNAKTEVILLTPNFTSNSAFSAVCFALNNGIRVHIITNRRMMVPEQLATAGALTEQFVDRLIKEYRRAFSGRKTQKRLAELAASNLPSIASPPIKEGPHVARADSSSPTCQTSMGVLKVSYFRQPAATANGTRSAHGAVGIASQANKSHIKLTLVDRKAIVLGSGNMDRASWRTSQELGVLIEDQDKTGQPVGAVERIWEDVERGLEGCLEEYFAG